MKKIFFSLLFGAIVLISTGCSVNTVTPYEICQAGNCEVWGDASIGEKCAYRYDRDRNNIGRTCGNFTAKKIVPTSTGF